MRGSSPVVLRPWLLPIVVLALVAPGIAAFALAGPQLGLAAGALTAGALIALAARARSEGRIEVVRAPDARRRVLVVASRALDDPALIEELAAIAAPRDRGAGRGAELRVVTPARSTRVDRWASDLDRGRAAAQRSIAVSLGGLAAAGLDAAGRVGDGDTVQAVEDELREFAATEVVLVAGPGVGGGEAGELRRRLDRPVRELAGPGSR